MSACGAASGVHVHFTLLPVIHLYPFLPSLTAPFVPLRPVEGDRGCGQRVHRGRDRQAHGLAARRDDGDEGRARGEGQPSASGPALCIIACQTRAARCLYVCLHVIAKALLTLGVGWLAMIPSGGSCPLADDRSAQPCLARTVLQRRGVSQ